MAIAWGYDFPLKPGGSLSMNIPDPSVPRAPVLLLIFNRPEATARVLAAIRESRPPRLYVAADGPRIDRPDEKKSCDLARSNALAVDWPCEVRTLLREKNLGCRHAVEEALDWFFDSEETGIVLEDDCVPCAAFFHFCDQLLEHYRNDQRVFSISGSNFQDGQQRGDGSYYASKHFHCWGWASWRRAWLEYRSNDNNPMPRELSQGLRRLRDGSRWFAPYWTQVADMVNKGEFNSWAYRVSLACFSRPVGAEVLHLIPNTNLVENIGFNESATHTRDASILPRPSGILPFPLNHPQNLSRDREGDRYTDRIHFGIALIPYLRRRLSLRFPLIPRLFARLGLRKVPRH